MARSAESVAEPEPVRQLSMRNQQTLWRSHLRTCLGVLLSLVFLILAFRDVQLHAVASTLRQVNLLLLAAAVGVEMATFGAIAARWQRLFTPHAPPSKRRLFGILTIAQLVNGVLPAKLGPLVRAYLAGNGESQGVAFALTTIAGEKLVEGISLLAIGAVLLPFAPLADWLRPASWVGVGLLLLALALVVWIAFRHETAGRWLERWLARWPRLLGAARSALAALDVWRDHRAMLALAGWSAVIWGITVLLNQLLLWSLGIDVPLVAPVLLMVVLQIGVRVPSSPGSIGVFHYLSVLTLSLFGVEKDLAFSYGVLLHLVTYLPPSVLGIAYLGRSGYSLSRLRQDAGTVHLATSSQGGQGDGP